MTAIKPSSLTRAELVRAGIGQDYWVVDFSTYQGPDNAKKAAVRYLQKLSDMKEQGVGLMFGGPPGPGKTTIMLIIAKYLLRARWRVFCTSLGEIVEQIQRSWSNNDPSQLGEGDFMESCRRADFLFIDDIGKEHRGQSGFVQTVFDNLIRYRVQHRLPTFLTTNLTKSELEGIYGDSVASLLEGKILSIQVIGDDHRKTVLKQQNREKLKS